MDNGYKPGAAHKRIVKYNETHHHDPKTGYMEKNKASSKKKELAKKIKKSDGPTYQEYRKHQFEK